MQRRFRGFEEDITRQAGLVPAFGHINIEVIELVFQALLAKSREKKP